LVRREAFGESKRRAKESEELNDDEDGRDRT
jgi:hypothetical protein